MAKELRQATDCAASLGLNSDGLGLNSDGLAFYATHSCRTRRLSARLGDDTLAKIAQERRPREAVLVQAPRGAPHSQAIVHQ
ncbi:MAG: hypothetical protein NVS2B4_13210 [Ramlibacter sp.]